MEDVKFNIFFRFELMEILDDDAALILAAANWFLYEKKEIAEASMKQLINKYP